jgi:hypothetical protein
MKKGNYFIAVNIGQCEALIEELKDAVEAAKYIKEISSDEDCNPKITIQAKECYAGDDDCAINSDVSINY